MVHLENGITLLQSQIKIWEWNQPSKMWETIESHHNIDALSRPKLLKNHCFWRDKLNKTEKDKSNAIS